MIRKFTIEKHDEYGYVGLAPSWMPGHQHDPLQGMGVAHDVLEHGPHDKVEWQGLGGSVLVRGVSGYFSRRAYGRNEPAENIASDFVELYRLWEGQSIPDPGRTRTLDDEYAEEIIRSAVRKGCELVRSELADHDEEQTTIRDWTNDAQRACMIGWMRHGYRACVHRWRDSVGMLCDTFVAIETEADRFLKHHKEYEGATVVLTFNPRIASASFELEADPYDY